MIALDPADRTVVVSTAGLDDELRSSIQAACTQAGAVAVTWGGEAAPPAEPGHPPGAVVAALPPGERQIPEPLVRLVTEDRPGAPLVLLCRESLVRPSVTLQSGRVVLVEPPFSVRRIASRLRVVLATGVGHAPPALTLPAGGPELVVHEYQRAGHWMGVVAPGAGWAPGIDQSRGLTVVVRDGPAPPVEPPATLVELVDLLTGGGEPEAVAAALPEVVGAHDAVIHLGPRGDEWLLFWPRTDRPLWLCSTLRLPACWDLAATAQESPGRCCRVPAAGGDVVVALSAGLSDWALGAASPGVPALVPSELADTVADGGPALLEAIASRMRGRPGPPGALVIEAR